MKMIFKYYIYLIALCLSVVSCGDKWGDHIGSGDPNAQNNLYDVLQANSEFSEFAKLLDLAGYSDELKASKNYTVVIPTNSAIAGIRDEYDFSDTVVVRNFVGYHLFNSVHQVNETADTVRVRNFRNKYVEFINGGFNGILPQQKDEVAMNGVFHVVNQPLQPLQNIFDLLHTSFAETAQVQAVRSFDTLYVDEETGLAYYRYHSAWNNDVRRHMVTESRKYTYFVVDDDYFTTEYEKILPYYHTAYEEGNTHRPDSTTTFFARKAFLRDYIVYGEFDENNLPAEFTSVSGTKFKLDPADLISSHKTSNGFVHRVRKLEYQLSDRINEFTVLGTNPAGYRQSATAAIFRREKRDLQGEVYKDLQIYGHGVTAYYARYRIPNAFSTRYKIYGRAITGLAGDPVTAAFTQHVHFYDPVKSDLEIEADRYTKTVWDATGNSGTRISWEVQPLNHEEVYLGEVEYTDFGHLMFLVMSQAQGPIVLEYLRFVPILP